MVKDTRRHRRSAYTGPVTIAWDDGHEVRYARGKCIEISESGLRLELQTAVAVGTSLLLRLERVGVSGAARVRHQKRYGAKYLTGLELNQPLGRGSLDLHVEDASLCGANSVV